MKLDGRSLSWKDLSHSTRGYEFVFDGTISAEAVNLFTETCYARMYERANHKQIQSEDQQATWIKELRAEAAYVSYKQPAPPLPRNVSTPVKKIPVAQQRTPASSQLPTQSTSPSFTAISQTPVGLELASTHAQLYMYDIRVDQFVLMKPDVLVKLIQTTKYEFSLYIESEGKAFIGQPIDSNMNPVFNTEQLAFVWVWFCEETGNPLYTWSLKFNNPSGMSTFKGVFGKCIYESLNLDSFEKLKKDESNYIVDAYTEDVEMKEAYPSSDEEEDELSEEGESAEENEIEVKENDFSKEAQKNSQLAVGYKTDRTFVVRGNKIGVFKYTEEDDLDHVTTINSVESLNGTKFAPRKVMLHEGDRSMLLMNPNDKHHIYKMDLEYGKVHFNCIYSHG